MRQYVADSFPDEICHLISGYISQFTCKAHITAPLTSQTISVCCLQNAGPFTQFYNGEGTLKTFEEMPYELKPGQMNFEAEKSKQSVNRDELKRRNNASAKKSRDVRRTREL